MTYKDLLRILWVTIGAVALVIVISLDGPPF
jgi:hypothetical protein